MSDEVPGPRVAYPPSIFLRPFTDRTEEGRKGGGRVEGGKGGGGVSEGSDKVC